MLPSLLKKAPVIAIPILLIASIFYISLSPKPLEFIIQVPSSPVTEYSSVEELENWIGVRIPRPGYLPIGYEIKSVYQVGAKPEQGENPGGYYLLYSDEEVNYGKITSNEELTEVVQTIGKPGGYKLFFLLNYRSVRLTVENVKNGTLNYINWVRENVKETDIQLIYINDMPAALETKSYGHMIVWGSQDWSFWFAGIPAIPLDELIKIAESIR